MVESWEINGFTLEYMPKYIIEILKFRYKIDVESIVKRI